MQTRNVLAVLVVVCMGLSLSQAQTPQASTPSELSRIAGWRGASGWDGDRSLESLVGRFLAYVGSRLISTDPFRSDKGCRNSGLRAWVAFAAIAGVGGKSEPGEMS